MRQMFCTKRSARTQVSHGTNGTDVNRLSTLFTQAERTIEGYNKGDQISRTAQETMRDIQKAADALASLARTIERNPNSLLLGR